MSDFFYLPKAHPFQNPNELEDDEVVALNCAMGTVYQGLVSAACVRDTMWCSLAWRSGAVRHRLRRRHGRHQVIAMTVSPAG